MYLMTDILSLWFNNVGSRLTVPIIRAKVVNIAANNKYFRQPDGDKERHAVWVVEWTNDR
jgi:hypothetical protein